MSEDHKFKLKWSEAIEQHGYTSVPNLLLMVYRRWNLSYTEVFLLIQIESYRWDRRDPYPSEESLSKRMNRHPRTVRRTLETLEKKGLVKRIYRPGTSSRYSVSGLVNKLDQIAVTTKPKTQKQPPSADKTAQGERTKTAYKENAAEKDSSLNKKGVEKVLDIISRKRSDKRYLG